MFETFSHLFLQQYWWLIISILASLLVFLMFVQGGQTLLSTLASNEEEKIMLINSLGRKWELTFTTLVTFGGAMFAAFPRFYAVSFSGAYWLWMAILFCFTIQAVSYEFRRKKGNVWGKRVYDFFLFINGSVGVFLIGVAVGTFFTGSAFTINANNQVIWNSSLRGIESVFNLQNVLLGFALFFLVRTLASLYFINNIADENIRNKSRFMVRFNAVPFVVTFIAFIVMLLLKQGFEYDPQTKNITEVPNKYLLNFIEMPLILIFSLTGVILVVWGILMGWLKAGKKGIWLAGAGTILTVFSLFIVAAYNHTPFYPSGLDPQSSLTIENSSSSHYTLTVMSYVSLFVPVVIAYIYWIWRLLDRKKMDKAELNENEHLY